MEKILVSRQELKEAFESTAGYWDLEDARGCNVEDMFDWFSTYLGLPDVTPDDSAPALNHYEPTGVLGK